MSEVGPRDGDAVRAALREHWDAGPLACDPLPGGMNSATWTVTARDRPGARWVAKLVGADQRESFGRGLRAAVRVDAAGIPAGAPEPTRAGHLSADVAGGVLALLRWVDGHPLRGAGAHEQRLMGDVLGRAHRALAGTPAVAPPAGRFPAWVDVAADHLDVEGWVRPAVATALDRYAALTGRHARGPLTCGVLHGDPAPEAFLWSPTGGRCGLIDWSSAVHGPLLYDLASAVMYVGGPARAGAVLRAYTRAAALGEAEITRGLDVLLGVRWAVQADYFARRLAADDRTGITGPGENLAGLHHARDFFASAR